MAATDTKDEFAEVQIKDAQANTPVVQVQYIPNSYPSFQQTPSTNPQQLAPAYPTNNYYNGGAGIPQYTPYPPPSQGNVTTQPPLGTIVAQPHSIPAYLFLLQLT